MQLKEKYNLTSNPDEYRIGKIIQVTNSQIHVICFNEKTLNYDKTSIFIKKDYWSYLKYFNSRNIYFGKNVKMRRFDRFFINNKWRNGLFVNNNNNICWCILSNEQVYNILIHCAFKIHEYLTE